MVNGVQRFSSRAYEVAMKREPTEAEALIGTELARLALLCLVITTWIGLMLLCGVDVVGATL